jgi:hypothetical protein
VINKNYKKAKMIKKLYNKKRKKMNVCFILTFILLLISVNNLLAVSNTINAEKNSVLNKEFFSQNENYPDRFVPELFTETEQYFDSLNLRFVDNWPFGVWTLAMAYDETRNIAFCGSYGGIYIFDVSIPSNPTKISEAIHTRDEVSGLFYESTTQRLYIADGIIGLEIWDTSSPSSPQKLGRYDTPGFAHDVAVSGSYVYLANASDGLRIIDISDLSSPIEVGHCDTPGGAVGITLQTHYAYIGDHDGLAIIDITNPTNPYMVGYCNTATPIGNIVVSGNYVYAASSTWGLTRFLRIIDVSNPSSPYEVGYFQSLPATKVTDVAIFYPYAYLAVCGGGAGGTPHS